MKKKAQQGDVAKQFWHEAERGKIGPVELYRKQADFLQEKVLPRLGASQEILDIGCGDGEYSLLFASRVSKVVGIDIGEKLIDQARARAELEGVDNIEFHAADIFDVEVTERFGAVSLMGVLTTIADDKAALQILLKAVDCLADNGLLILKDSVLLDAESSQLFRDQHYEAKYRPERDYIAMCRLFGLELVERQPLETMDNYGETSVMYVFRQHLPRPRTKTPASGPKVACYASMPFHFRSLRPLSECFENSLLSMSVEEVMEWQPEVIVVSDGWSVRFWREYCDAYNVRLIGMRHGSVTRYGYAEPEYNSADWMCGSAWDIADAINSDVMPRFGYALTGNTWVDETFRIPFKEADETAPTILFAPTYNPEISAAVYFGDRIIQLIREVYPQSTILIKPHPAIVSYEHAFVQDKDLFRDLMQQWRAAAEHDEKVILIDDPEASIAESFAKADILVADASSLIFEFMTLERPILLYASEDRIQNWEYNPDAPGNAWRDIGLEFSNDEQFVSLLRQSFELHSTRTLPAQQHRTRQLYGHFQDGCSIDRVVDFICNIPRTTVMLDVRHVTDIDEASQRVGERLNNIDLRVVNQEFQVSEQDSAQQVENQSCSSTANEGAILYLSATSTHLPDNASLARFAAHIYRYPREAYVYRSTEVDANNTKDSWLRGELAAIDHELGGQPLWLYCTRSRLIDGLPHVDASFSIDLWRQLTALLPTTYPWPVSQPGLLAVQGVYPRVGADDFYLGPEAVFSLIPGLAEQGRMIKADAVLRVTLFLLPGTHYSRLPAEVTLTLDNNELGSFELCPGEIKTLELSVENELEPLDLRIESNSTCPGLSGLTRELSLLAAVSFESAQKIQTAFTAAHNETSVVEVIETVHESTTLSLGQVACALSTERFPELKSNVFRHQLYKDLVKRTAQQSAEDLEQGEQATLSNELRAELMQLIHLLERELELSQTDPEVLALKDALRELVLLSDYRQWINNHALMEIDAQIHAERMLRWQSRPDFHFFMFVFDGELPLLANTIDALGQQFYDKWKLTVIADSQAPDPMFEALDELEWLVFDPASQPYDFLNQAIETTQADWIAFIPAGTSFEAQSLLQFGDYIDRFPHYHAIYSDDDMLTENGWRKTPRFKPDFNLDWLRSDDYIGMLMCRRTCFSEIGGFDAIPGGENHSLALKVFEHHGAEAIGHISDVLVHLPDTVMALRSFEMTRQVVQNHLSRSRINARIENGLLPHSARVIYQWAARPKVSIIIPTKDKLEFLRPCVESVLNKTQYSDFELIVVNNRSDQVDTLEYLREIALLPNVRVLDYPHPFNYAAISNMAAKEAEGEYLLFLNNDTEVLHSEWLERMMSYAQRQEVGVVGARLVLPETGLLQHAGVVMGMSHVADHPYLGELEVREAGYLGRAQLDQNYSAVTGACLLIRKSLYSELGGMNEKELAVLYNDVDLCLRAREAGQLVVWTPYAMLVHHGSVTQKSEYLQADILEASQTRAREEADYMFKRWLPVIANDPAYNRHLSLACRDMRIEYGMPTNWDTNFHDRQRILGLPLQGGSGQYRIIQPFTALSQEGIAQCEFYHNSANAVRPVMTSEYARMAPDAVVFHAAVNSEQIRQIEQLAKFLPQIRRIYCIDDLLTNVPEQSPAHREIKRHFADAKSRLRRALKSCNRLIVSTQPLADLCREMIDDIHVVPNRLPRQPWTELKSRRNQGDKPRVGWAGAQQHHGDLAIITDVVKATSEEVDWIFMGMCPDELQPYIKEFHPFVSIDQYPQKLASLNLDLAVAPLEIHPFNEAKSNLRLLEYGILGWPVICTDIYPYQTLNPPVTRIDNDSGSWLAAIRQKLADKQALADEGQALRNWVMEHYILEDHLQQWAEALLSEPDTND